MENIFVCPKCKNELEAVGDNFSCSLCKQLYPISRGVPDFRGKTEYWCNVSRDKMLELNSLAEESGDWRGAAEKIIPKYMGHFDSFFRADGQFLWPTNSNSRILDAGCMWGGLTIPVAQFHREVYAVDKTIETLDFLKIRSRQMGYDNVFPVASPVNSLPFKDGFFDLIILNGVLEWVGLDEDTILEQHWEGKREGKTSYKKNPEEMQLAVLKELHRVLKPGGFLYVAIENRYGVQYFLSYPDDHNNVKFVTFLPRFLANMISKVSGKGEYRTYVYSPSQLDKLLRKGQFSNISMYGTFPHYIKIKKAFPLKMTKLFKNEIRVEGRFPRILHAMIRPLIPSAIAESTIPSLLAVCGKGNDEITPRVQKILIEAEVLEENINYNFVIANSRYADCNSTNMIIYKGQDPVYYCKVARNPNCSSLKTEADNLNWLSELLPTSNNHSFRLPDFIYFGEVDGVTILVTQFLNANNFNVAPFYILNKGFGMLGNGYDVFKRALAFVEEKLFLHQTDKHMTKSIDSLVEFQKATLVKQESFKIMSRGIIEEYLKREKGSDGEINEKILKLEGKIDEVADVNMFTCAVHGDYDFDNVLFFGNGQIGLVDFEHCESEGSPFYDLTHLIFNPLILKWKAGYSGNLTFKSYLNRYGAIDYVNYWLKRYCNKLSLPHTIVSEIPLLGVLRQNSKSFPAFRDPYTYPLHGEDILTEFLELEI